VSPTNHWKLGLFVVVGLATMLALAFWFGAKKFRQASFTAVSYFDEPVTGLEIGSPVRFRGMTIGNVSDIRAATDRHHLAVQMSIDVQKLEEIGLRDPEDPDPHAVLIPYGLRARIERSFVTGVAFLQTDFFDISRYPIPQYPFDIEGNTLHSVPSSQKTFERGVEDLLVSVPQLILSLEALTQEVHVSLQGAEVGETMKVLRATFDDTRRAITAFDWPKVYERTVETIAAATDASVELKDLAKDLRADDGVLAKLSADVHSLTSQLESTVRDAGVPALTASLRRAADGLHPLTDDASDTLIALRQAADAFRQLTELLERDPGALLRGREPAADPRRQ
jgi:ABC-type transporter Mla subunit MlaD